MSEPWSDDEMGVGESIRHAMDMEYKRGKAESEQEIARLTKIIDKVRAHSRPVRLVVEMAEESS